MSRDDPTRLGNYRLGRRIGRGGMAEVYLARREGDLVDRDLVVKRMLPNLADDERFVQMFLREARIAMRLSHPNVVQVFDVGVDGEEHFIAMEHLDGLPLHALAKRLWHAKRSLTLPLVTRTISDAALGLHYAHTLVIDGKAAHLVHRDVSPDNLFVVRSGATKVLDFGIAAGAFAGRLTRTGEVKGKVRYMPPEQIEGNEVDARADVYALGVTLYWLLTGRHPFDGRNEVATIRAVMENAAPAPSSINPEVPGELDELVALMMHKDPAQRMASTDVVYEVLQPFWGGASGAREVVSLLAEAMELPPAPKRTDDPDIKTWVPENLGFPATVRGAPSGANKRAIEATVPLPRSPSRDATASMPVARSAEVGEHPAESTEPTRPPMVPEPAATRPRAAAATGGDGPTAPALEPTRRFALDELSGAPATKPRSRAPLAIAAALGVVAVAVAVVLAVRPSEGASAAHADAGAAPAAAVVDAGAPASAAVPATVADDASADAGTPAAEGGDTDAPPEPQARERSVGKKVRASAPAFVEWRTAGGGLLGTGGGALTIPKSATSIVAVNPRLKGRTVVPVADKLDYDALPKGELAFVVVPYADVTLGTKKLGRTPDVKAQTLVAGTYEVRLTWNDKVRTVKIDVPPNGKATVRANMSQ